MESSKKFHRKLGNFKKIPEMLRFDVSFPAVLPIAKFRRFSKTFHRKLGNFKKIPEMLRFDGKFLTVHPKPKVRRFLVKNCKTSALNCSTRK